MNNFIRKDAILSIFVLLLFAGFIAAIGNAPIQGGNLDNWGTALNAWVGTSINGTGGFLNTLSVNSSAIVGASVINTTHILNDNITAADLTTSSVNSTHIVNGDAGVGLADMAASSVNGTHIVSGTITSNHIALGGLNVTALTMNTSNANFSITASNFSNITFITKMKIVTGVTSSATANSTQVSDGDVKNTSIIILTLGTNMSPTVPYPCQVANLTTSAFNVTCYPNNLSFGLGNPAPFLFNYMLINPA